VVASPTRAAPQRLGDDVDHIRRLQRAGALVRFGPFDSRGQLDVALLPRQRREQRPHDQGLIAHQPHVDPVDERNLARIRVRLDDLRPCRDLCAGRRFELVEQTGAQEHDQVGGADERVVRLVLAAEIRMIGGESRAFQRAPVLVQDGHAERFAEADEIRDGTGAGDLAAGHDHRTDRRGDQVGGGADRLFRGDGARIEGESAGVERRCVARRLQQVLAQSHPHRAGRLDHGGPECPVDVFGNAFRGQ
jgi:hypothetical protein